MIYKDRTSEFYSLAERIKKRGKGAGLDKGRSFYGNGNSQKKSNPPSDFAKMASQLGRGIAQTCEKVEHLAAMTKSRKSLERPVEVAELTYKIKQDIAALNQQISSLQNHNKNQRGPTQMKEHKNSVLLSLQSKLADTSLEFKSTLEMQSEVTASGGTPLIDSRPQPRRRVNATRDISPQQQVDDDSPQSLGIPMITPQQQQQQQQQQIMLEQNDRNIESRSAAMETIESTIAELGGIFQQLATMVAEQRETIQRIDQNTDDIEMNVLGARSELLKYFQNMSGNRGFIIKVFITVILLFLLFSVIL